MTEVGRVVRMEVLRDHGNLQVPEDPRGPRVGDVKDEEGVDSPERDEVCAVPDEPRGEHAFPRREAREVADWVQQ